MRTAAANYSIKSSMLALLALMAGCASWNERGSPDSEAHQGLTPLRESSKSVVIGVEFVPVGAETLTVDDFESLWQWVDETAINLDQRRSLLANGLRAGRVLRGDRVRSRLDTMKSSEGIVDEFLSQAEIATEISKGVRRIPMLIGRRYELPLRRPLEGSQVTLVRVGDETIGRTLTNPQFLYAVTLSETTSPGQVNLRLRPEVQYGSMRQRWVSSDSALRIDTRRDAWSLQHLDIDLDVAEGDTLMIAGTTPLIGLGKQMLSGSNPDQSAQYLVVLINVVQVPTIADQL